MQKKQVLVPVLILIGVVVVLFVVSLFFRKKETSVIEIFKKEIVANLKDGYSVKDTIFESLDNKNQQVIAIFHWVAKDGMWQQDSLVVYELKGENLAGLFDTTEWVLELGNDIGGDSFRVEDINKDGLKEFVVSRSLGGNCWTCASLLVFQVKDHKARQFLGKLPWSQAITEIRDLNGDGIKELIVLDAEWEDESGLCHACSPQIDIIYAWKKDDYREASIEFPSYYDDRIREAESEIQKRIRERDGLDYYIGSSMATFFDYIQKGQKAKGWEIFANYMSQENIEKNFNLDEHNRYYKEFAKQVVQDFYKRYMKQK
jgi:hypothetical protein